MVRGCEGIKDMNVVHLELSGDMDRRKWRELERQ